MHLAIDHAMKAKCPKTALGCVSAQVERTLSRALIAEFE